MYIHINNVKKYRSKMLHFLTTVRLKNRTISYPVYIVLPSVYITDSIQGNDNNKEIITITNNKK